MIVLITGYAIICFLCFIKVAYGIWYKQKAEIENIVYMLNIMLKSSLSIKTVKVLLIIFYLAIIGIIPIIILTGSNDKEKN